MTAIPSQRTLHEQINIMRLINKLRDKLRNIAGIRVERQLPPPTEKPPIGSNIVREKLRMRLKYPISDELWKFLTAKGWRTVDMRLNRRRYTIVPDKVLVKLMKASEIERQVLHARLVKPGRHAANSNLGSTASSAAHHAMKSNQQELAFERNSAE
jgi:hypothetical protein